MANPTPESILKLASYQFYNPKLLERESRLDSTATDCHDDPNQMVPIRFGVQFWPGDKGKATWFFTWDTSPTTQRVLVPDVYGTLKARTIKKADLIFGESEVPPPARDVYTGQAVIWVVEWPLGSFILDHRREIEDYARTAWKSLPSPAKWAENVITGKVKECLRMNNQLFWCLQYAQSAQMVHISATS